MGQLFLMFVLALSPIICLIIALIALKQQAWIASFEALAVAVVVSMVGGLPLCALAHRHRDHRRGLHLQFGCLHARNG